MPKRIRRPCVPDDFEEELTQEECDMIDKWFPQYEEVEMEADEAGDCPTTRTKCVCGSMIMPKGMKSHEKSKKHLAFISETPEEHEEIIKIDSILI